MQRTHARTVFYSALALNATRGTEEWCYKEECEGWKMRMGVFAKDDCFFFFFFFF